MVVLAFLAWSLEIRNRHQDVRAKGQVLTGVYFLRLEINFAANLFVRSFTHSIGILLEVFGTLRQLDRVVINFGKTYFLVDQKGVNA